NELRLPEVSEGEKLTFVDLTKEQKFTQPPARYNDASLIKALEEMGIGRPSTYAPTLSTIQDRQYVEKIEKRFKPTSLGLAVNDFLMANFSDIVDYKFTAHMEDELDEIANGVREWRPVIKEFYEPFAAKLGTVTETAARVKVEVETTGEKCPKCAGLPAGRQGDVIIRLGKFGKFLACSRYPECNYKANYQNKTGQKCPKCGGDVIVRKTRSGRSFYGCSNYPKCDFASWTKPKSI
ncbi:MAG: topoisomerase protein, partial [Candidatus Amesbacteria bacterium GW2011_GWA2_47_70]